MIFNTNSTSLGNYSTPMAEGYNGACGADLALVLIENARNDYAMFEAMLNVDAQELAIKKNESGYVTEGAIKALQESSSGGIRNKLKELIRKFIAKIKAIFHNFLVRISSLFMKDDNFINKYKSEISKKSVDNLEVKWRKIKEDDYSKLLDNYDKYHVDILNPASKYKDKSEEEIYNMVFKEIDYKVVNDKNINNNTDFKEAIMNQIFEDDSPVKYEIKEIGGIQDILDKFEDIKKNIKDAEKHIKKLDTLANKEIARLDRVDIENSQLLTIVTRIKQSIFTTQIIAFIDVCKIIYSQSKAAIIKAIKFNPKKLENAIYYDTLAEVAAEEVEDVIDGAIDSESISDSCNADRTIKDCDVCDDPDELTYGEDYYASDDSSVKTSGTVDSDINSKSESAYFGKLFY